MSTYVLDFQENDKTKLKLAGGKGANRCALSAISGMLTCSRGRGAGNPSDPRRTAYPGEWHGRVTGDAIKREVFLVTAASTTAVELLDPRDHLGPVEPGKPTHLIAVQGDHLTDITALRQVKFVMNGVIVVDTTHRLIC